MFHIDIAENDEIPEKPVKEMLEQYMATATANWLARAYAGDDDRTMDAWKELANYITLIASDYRGFKEYSKDMLNKFARFVDDPFLVEDLLPIMKMLNSITDAFIENGLAPQGGRNAWQK